MANKQSLFFDLKGKTALITGAAKRIGRQIALALASKGVNIVIHYNTSVQYAEYLAEEITKIGVKYYLLQADLEVPEEAETLSDRAWNLTGGYQILVNNASIFPQDTINSATYESISRNFMINAWAPLLISRKFAKKAETGKIINILDSRTKEINPKWHVSYLLSKKMLETFTNMMALEYAPGITVNGVSPGLILPPPGKDMSYIERLKDSIPLKKVGDPAQVVDAVLFLLKNDFITGQVIAVDGGRHLKNTTDG
jgi:NAD(P)-dependent dehydrogenase (short-subunit alcohol dehydrogenase family)